MTQTRLLRNSKAPASMVTMAAGACVSLSTCGLYYYTNQYYKQSILSEQSANNVDDNKNSKKASSTHKEIFETDFTEKLASKPYLTYHTAQYRHSLLSSTIQTSKKLWSKFARDDVNPHIMNNNNNYYNSSDDERGVYGIPYDEDGLMLLGSGSSGGGKQRIVARPKGVPRRVRILAIDVPELREVFDGECRVNLSRIYPDDIAPPKIVKRRAPVNKKNTTTSSDSTETDNTKNNTTTTTTTTTMTEATEIQKIEVIQKSLARSIVRCRNTHSKRIGIELLEASVYDLNPYNMRRTYQFGQYKYDPGKYGNSNSRSRRRGSKGNNGKDDMLQRRMSVQVNSTGPSEISRYHRRKKHVVKDVKGGDVGEEDDDDSSNEEETYADVESIDDEEEENKEKEDKETTTVAAVEDDEIDAPWNQYAWIEEMKLRINGYVPFGANVERSSFLSRILYGTCYRRTVHSSRSYFHWFIPSFLSGRKIGDEDGIDGDYGRNKRTINRASSKPHAVIADGSAIQRVPGALRYLTKCCQEADVSLFIINDPRVWGGNTHSDLKSAVKDMRRTIKTRIISNALAIKEGKMFERGRLLGKLETEAKWQVRDAGRRTRQALQDAADRLKKEREDDWSKLNDEELMQKLIDRKVITVAYEKQKKESNGEGGEIQEEENVKIEEYTEALATLCRQYLDKQKSKNDAPFQTRPEQKSANVNESTSI